MRTLLLLVLALTALLFMGCSSNQKTPTALQSTTAEATDEVAVTVTPASHESAGDAVKRMFDFVATGQWGREWDELHPGQQSLVSREEYVDCAQGSSLNITSVDVVETHDDPIDLTGVPEKTSEAVTVKLSTAEDTTTVIVHEVLVAGEWRWVLGNIAIATFEGGRCP